MTDIDQYALQRSLFGGTNTEIHNKAYREELHAREKDHIPNPNVNPGQYAPKGGRNPLLKVVQHANGWTASTMLPGGKEFRVEGNSHQEAVSNAIRAGEKLGHVFDPPKPEPEIGGLFHGGMFDEKQHPREQVNAGTKHAGQFAPKHTANPVDAMKQAFDKNLGEAPFVLQRPKKNRAVAKFDNNANTKQGGLFDAGKKGELPGQNLLFNSDAGDQHNPKTMENKARAIRGTTEAHEPIENVQREVTPRRLKLAANAINRLKQRHPLFSDQVEAEEGTPAERISRLDSEHSERWANRDAEDKQKFLEASKKFDTLPEHIKHDAVAHWNLSGRVSSGHEIANFIGNAISGRSTIFKGIAHPEIEDNEIRDQAEAIEKSRAVITDMVSAGKGMAVQREQQFIAQLKELGVTPNTVGKHPPLGTAGQSLSDKLNALRQDSAAAKRKSDEELARQGKLFGKHGEASGAKLEELASEYGVSPHAMASGTLSDDDLAKLPDWLRQSLPKPAVKYSRRVYEQFEHETERYLRDYTLYDVDRYGIGGKLMRTILAFMAMHAMSGLIGKQPQGGAQKKPAQASTPSNQDFEKLHPRETVQGGNHKPGQFAKKHAGASPLASAQGQRRESTLSSTLHHDPKQIEREQQAADMKNHLAGLKSLQPHFKKKAADQARADKAAEREAARAAAKEAKENPDWLKQAQEAMVRQAAKPRTGAFADDAPPVPHSPSPPSAPSVPIQAPQDRHTAKVAEIWHGKPEQPAQPSTAPAISNTPTAESFTNEVLQHHAGQSESSPRNYPDNLNKPPEEQTNYAPPERSIHDVMRNPAWEKQKAEEQEPYSPGDRSIHDIMRNPAWEKQKEKEASEKRTMFNPNEFGDTNEEVGNKEYNKPRPTEEEFSTPEHLEKMKQWRASRPKNEADLPAWRKQKPETFESATKKWKRGMSRVATQNKKAINEGNPDENIASVASEYEIDHEPFSKYINEMQAFEQDQWKQREAVKSGIRKAWGVHGGTLRDMENKGLDNSSLASTDNLKGNLTDAQINEHLGSDEGSWSQNAWDMLREDPPPKPGAHDREWLDGHAKAFLRLQSMHQPEPAEYPEPEDGMPFSNRSLAMAADRYFRQFNAHQNQNSPQNWTILDQWV